MNHVWPHLRKLFLQALKASSHQIAAQLDGHLLLWVLISQGDYSWESETANESLSEGEAHERGEEARVNEKEDDGMRALSRRLPSAWPRVFSPGWKEG